MRKFLLSAFLVLAPTVAGCQACVVDSTTKQDPPSSDPASVGTVMKARPRLMSPAAHLVLKDAGDGDE